MNQNKRKIILYVNLVICIILVLPSCNHDDFEIGSDLIESKSQIILIDTFELDLATILLDSIPTSADSNLIVGCYSDSTFGKIICNGIFSLGVASDQDIQEEDEYDSICLVLYYNGYYYGDTNSSFGFTINELSEIPEAYDNNYIYNTNIINYKEETLGYFSNKPRPSESKSIVVKLTDSLGLKLFRGLKDGIDDFDNNSAFSEYFNGIIINADTTISKSVIGFRANSISMRLYYHRFGELLTEMTYDFPLVNTDLQYNQIGANFSQSKNLNNLNTENPELNSKLTNNRAFMQAGVGLLQKITFPSLSEILYLEKGSLLKAELVIVPEEGSYNHYSLPKELILYKANKYNHLYEAIYDINGNIQTGNFILDEFYHKNTSYTFDLTKYITEQIDNGYIKTEEGLMVTMNTDNFGSRLDFLILSSLSNQSLLKIYYIKF